MPRALVRSGRQRAALAAEPSLVADVLGDPAAVVELLGDLLDQRRSVPDRWVVPRLRLGLTAFDVQLDPTFSRAGDDVRIEARTTPASDADGRVVLDLRPTPVGQQACRLVTTWRLELRIPIPRAALSLAAPALDRTITRTVDRIMQRTETAVLEAVAD